MSQKAAIKRRSQARNGYRHLALIGNTSPSRPLYSRADKSTQTRRLAETIAKERAIALRKGMSKKR